MTELRGCLQDFGLVPLVRFGAERGKSGCLRISHASWVGEVAFADGRVVAAAFGDEHGAAAFGLIALALADGDFIYTDAPSPSVEPNIGWSATQLHVELDQLMSRPTHCGGRPLLRSVPRVTLSRDETSNQQVALNRSELALLVDVDGRRTTREILQGRDPVRALHALTRLSEAGVIELEAPNGLAETEVLPELAPRAAPEEVVARPTTPSASSVAVAAAPARVVPWRLSVVRDIAGVAAMTVLFVLVLRTLVQSVHVEGQSMLPGLQDGQLLLVNRVAYVFGRPQRGDVVVFRAPSSPDSELVKRITGLPGEQVRFEGGSVFVNDRVLSEPYSAPETGGIDPYPADGQSITVQNDSYFVLGDNRSVSLDSRLGWLVRADQLVGPAWLSYWPPGAWRLIDQPLGAEIPLAVPGDVQPAAAVPAETVPAPTAIAALPAATVPAPTAVAAASTPSIAPTVRPPASPIGTLLAGAVKDQLGWPSDPSGAAWLDGASYRLAVRQAGRFVAVTAPLSGMFTDVVVTAAFHKTGGPPGGGYGIIVRDEAREPRDGLDQGGQFYVAEAGDRGEIGIWRRENDHWVDILSWAPSKAVYPGGTTNQLSVRAVGPRLTFVVNGTEIFSLLDAALPSGRVGAFVGGDHNEVVLDQFAVELPPITVVP
jgi:signal peptidase I